MRKLKKKLVLWIVLALFWQVIRSAVGVEKLEEGLYAMEYPGDYGLDEFLAGGGASSDLAVANFVIDRAFYGIVDLNLQGSAFGCSTLAVTSPEGNALFGRNFDWGNCAALIVQTRPKDGYASISTVNMDFLNLGLNLPEESRVRLMSVATPYAPMDGMNEAGLCVAVLMIEDSPAFDQATDKPDLTTTTAVRLLLDISTFSSCFCGITMLPPRLTVFYFTVSHRGSISKQCLALILNSMAMST